MYSILDEGHGGYSDGPFWGTSEHDAQCMKEVEIPDGPRQGNGPGTLTSESTMATACSGAMVSIAPGLAGLAREGPVTVAWPREVVGRNVELVGACKTPHWDRAEPREPTMGD